MILINYVEILRNELVSVNKLQTIVTDITLLFYLFYCDVVTTLYRTVFRAVDKVYRTSAVECL